MSTYTPTVGGFAQPREQAREAPRPPVKGGPVLMADCITPAGGETLLSLLWKRWDEKSED